MYKHWTINELRNILSLPKNYKVDACIIYGGHSEQKFKKIFLSSLKNKTYSIEKLEDKFIKKILSVKIGKKRIWFIVEYGGARLSEFTHFASMLGSKRNILLGSCGGLKKGLDKFDILIPTYSDSTESSCHMYLRNKRHNKFYPDKDLSKKAINLLKKELNVVSGPVITCQAMMAETWNDICKWSNKGFYGVEMEASTVFAVSQHFKVPATAILQIGDNLIEKETVESESYKEKRYKLHSIKKYLFEVALKLSLN
jgi:purine-nucleoside phosphorylase